MTIRLAISGYGRIGRCILRAFFENYKQHDIKIVAINDSSGITACQHFTKYDSTHGRFNYPVTIQDDNLIVNGEPIKVISERDPNKLPWRELNVDIVLECTGKFNDKAAAIAHIDAGAKKVLISAPAKNVDATVVYGVNHHILKNSDIVVSNASCTTNCLAVIAKPLQDKLGIESGLVTTVHAYTKDQCLLDGNHKDFNRARAAAQSIIPTKTGAAEAIGLILPELTGKLDALSLRVPTHNVSIVDLTFISTIKTSSKEVNQIMLEEKSKFLDINDESLVSVDFNHHDASAIFDTNHTQVNGNLVKVLAWYDNEWGFANRMLDTALHMAQQFEVKA
jgi:glyceraldehyde 3-phosphate dehydrogenase